MLKGHEIDVTLATDIVINKEQINTKYAKANKIIDKLEPYIRELVNSNCENQMQVNKARTAFRDFLITIID